MQATRDIFYGRVGNNCKTISDSAIHIYLAWMNGFTTVAQYQCSSGKTKTSYDEHILELLKFFPILHQRMLGLCVADA